MLEEILVFGINKTVKNSNEKSKNMWLLKQDAEIIIKHVRDHLRTFETNRNRKTAYLKLNKGYKQHISYLFNTINT